MKKVQGGNKRYRTYQIHVKKGHRLYAYFEELALHSNNLYNTTNFYIRQIYTALKQDKGWQPLQKEVMDTIHHNIGKMNDQQHKAYLKRIENEMKKPESKRKEVKSKSLPITYQRISLHWF